MVDWVWLVAAFFVGQWAIVFGVASAVWVVKKEEKKKNGGKHDEKPNLKPRPFCGGEDVEATNALEAEPEFCCEILYKLRSKNGR